MNSTHLNILVLEDDSIFIDAAVEIFQDWCNSGLIKKLIILTVDESGFPDIEALVIEQSAVRTENLVTHVSRIGAMSNIRITGVHSARTAVEQSKFINSYCQKLAGEFKRVTPPTTVIDEVRVHVPSYTLGSLPSDFFNLGATNYIVIPEDRISQNTAARPVEVEDESFIEHMCAEICSLLGLWGGIGESNSTLDPVSVSGLGVANVRFVRSFVRIVRSPAPPISEILPKGEVLPIAPEFEPSPDPEWTARESTRELFPSEFVFVLPERQDTQLKLKPSEMIVRFLKELIQAVKGVPRFYIRGFVSDIEAGAASAVQSLYGQHSWIGLTNDQNRVLEESESVLDVETIKANLVNQTERPNLASTPSPVWTNFTRELLSLVDGGIQGEEVRKRLGSNKFVLVDKNYLAFEPTESASEFASYLVGKNNVAETEGHVSTSSILNENETNDLADESNTPEIVQDQIRFDDSLLGQLGLRFKEEAKRARNTLDSCVDKISKSKSPQSNVGIDIAKSVTAIIVACATVLVIGVASFTSLHHIFTFENFTSLGRARLWVVFTLLVLYLSSLNLTPRDNKRAQTYLVVSTTSFVASLSAAILYFPPIYRFFRRILDWSGELPILVLTGFTTLLVIFAFRKKASQIENSYKWRKGTMVALLYIYLLVGAIVGLSRPGSFVQDMSEGARGKLKIFLIVVGLSGLLASLIVVAVIRIRERNYLSDYLERIRWEVKVAEYAAAQEKLLKLREIQWNGTALALARLIWFPLGLEIEQTSSNRIGSAKNSLNKFQVAEITLNKSGTDYFVNRACRLFASPGWLTGQYERLVREFSQQYSKSAGFVTEDLISTRPETCSFPESLENVKDSKITSRRWLFSDSLCKGLLDGPLRSESLSEGIRNTYSEIIRDSDLYSLSLGGNNSIESFLANAGNGDSCLLPNSVVALSPIYFAGSNQNLQTNLWWPSSVVSISKNADHESEIMIDDMQSVFLAVRLDKSVAVSEVDLGIQSIVFSENETVDDGGTGL